MRVPGLTPKNRLSIALAFRPYLRGLAPNLLESCWTVRVFMEIFGRPANLMRKKPGAVYLSGLPCTQVLTRFAVPLLLRIGLLQ